MADRREFLRIMVSTLGCAVLGGCGGSSGSGGGAATGGGGAGGTGGGGSPPIPNGFRLTPVVGNGDPLSDGLTVVQNLLSGGQGTKAQPDHPFAWFFEVQQEHREKRKSVGRDAASVLGGLPGNIWVTDQGKIAFLALDDRGGRGMYVADVEESDSGLRLGEVRKVIRTSDRLPDGSYAISFQAGDIGGTGIAVIKVKTGDNGKPLMLTYRQGELTPLLGTNQRIPSLFPNGRTSRSLDSTVSISDDDSILIAPVLNSAWEMHSLGQALLHLPQGRLDDAEIVLRSGDLVPDTTSKVETIAGFQLADGGRYIAMGSATPRDGTRSARTTGDSEPVTYLVSGTVRDRKEVPRLVAGARDLGTSPLRARSAGYASGNLRFVPRLGASGTTAYVVRLGAGRDALYIDGRLILTAAVDGSGDRSPGGDPVRQLFAPTVTGPGQAVCVLGTDTGHELALFGNGRAASILRTNDPLGEKYVAGILMGFTPRHANRKGRIAFRVDFTDHTSSIVIGDPV